MDNAAKLNQVLAGRYTIERQIGAGGMATVYLARDIKHNRNVALKVLRPELGAVLGPERFLSEINVTANLQHPHLLPLFDSGEANGLLFYVMPFVDGESLRDRLEREHQLPIDEAVRIGVAIASALDYAHKRKVIHRDLKPENILLQGGQPMITDFGIALAVSNAGGARVTQTGLSLGTPQYMSPEQATGDRGIDARSDIYSLAAIIYEMLTGDPPHMGSTTQAIIARVLTDRPQRPRVIRDTVPEHVDAAVMHALSKIPADRFSTAGEFAEALSGTRAVAVPRPASMQPTMTYDVVPAGSQWRRRLTPALIWLPIGLLAGSLGAIALMSSEQRPDRAAHFQIAFADSTEAIGGSGVSIAISRDGSALAFVGDGPQGRGIYHRRLDGLEARFIRGTENGISPEFSPDGQSLAFILNNTIKKVPVTGGAPIPVGDTVGNHLSWSDRGEIIFHYARGIARVSVEGGPHTIIARPDSSRGHLRYAWPNVLPGGKMALITLYKGGTDNQHGHLGVLSLRDSSVTELNVSGLNARYVPSGHILFGRADGSVFAAAFSLRRLRVTGPAVPVLESVSLGPGGALKVVISENGTLLYMSMGTSAWRSLVAVNREGKERILVRDTNFFSGPRIDPTGRRMAVARQHARNRTDNSDVWTFDLNSGASSRVTTDSVSHRPEWLPDGQRIAFVGTGTQRLWGTRVRPWDGTGTAETLTDTGVHSISFSQRGKYLAVRRQVAAGATAVGGDIWIAPIDSPRALRPFLTGPATEITPAVSPDGRLIAYVSDETGGPEVYLRPLPGPGGRATVSIKGGIEPVWSPDGRELFYRSPTHIMSATIVERPELDVARRDTLFADAYVDVTVATNYGIFPNGKEFVFVHNQPSTQRGFYGIANFSEELTRRTGEARIASKR